MDDSDSLYLKLSDNIKIGDVLAVDTGGLQVIWSFLIVHSLTKTGRPRLQWLSRRVYDMEGDPTYSKDKSRPLEPLHPNGTPKALHTASDGTLLYSNGSRSFPVERYNPQKTYESRAYY